MRVGGTQNSLFIQRNLGAANSAFSSAAEKLSSGLRINKAADDAAGLSISSQLSVSQRVFAKAIQNGTDALSVLAISESAVKELERISVRQRELATQSANGTYSDNQRVAMNAEGRALTDEYNRIIATTSFNGRSLLNGDESSMTIQLGFGEETALAFELTEELATQVSAGSYFMLDGVEHCYVWFTVDGAGSDPAPAGTAQGFRVDLFSKSEEATPDTVQAQVLDGSSYTQSGPADGFYLFMSSGGAYVWFNVLDGATDDPMDPWGTGGSGIRVDINSTDTADQVAQALAGAISSSGLFTVASVENDSVVIESSLPGQYGAWVDNFSGSTTLSYLDPGVDARPAFSAETIAAAVKSALDGSGRFTVQDIGKGELIVTNTSKGIATDSRDVSSGIVLVDTLDSGDGRTYLPMGQGVSELFSLDLNGDGLQDLSTTNTTSQTITVRLNNGDGTFSEGKSYSMGSGLTSALLKDLNGDGLADMASVDSTAGTVSVRLNLGDGTFSGVTAYASGSNPLDAKFADINGDGRPDMVVTERGSDAVSVRLNQGNGQFGSRTAYALAGSATVKARDTQLVDFNGDGVLDLATCAVTPGWAYSEGSAYIQVRVNNGDGTFKPATQIGTWLTPQGQPVYEDINGDNRKDIIMPMAGSHWTRTLMNNGTGSSFGSLTNYSAGGWADQATLTDIDGDSDLDMILETGNYSNNVTVRYNAGGTFNTSQTISMWSLGSPSDIQNVFMADLNHDNRPDMVAVDTYGNRVRISMNNGAGTFAAPVSYSTGNSPKDAEIADLNGDGHLDIVTTNSSGSVSALFGTGTGAFGAAVQYGGASGGSVSKLVDIDGDGNKDLISYGSGTGGLSILSGDETGGFSGDETNAVTRLVFGNGGGMTRVNHINLATKQGALAAMSALDQRVERIHLQLGSYGAVQARLQVALATLSEMRNSYIGAQARIEDADVAQETAVLVNSKILRDIGASILAQANQSSSIALQLLGA